MFTRSMSVLALACCCSFSYAEDAVEIPLSEIWALKMPGTINVRDLEPRKDMDHRNTVASQIARKFFLRSNGGQAKAGPCFLVEGEGKDALINAAKVLVDGAAFPESIPADEKVSLVFYSYPAPGYVHLKSVHRSESAVTVKYQVVTHRTTEVTTHFALIPLGKLQTGQFNVEAIEVPSETPYRNHELTDRAACDSCTFTIHD